MKRKSFVLAMVLGLLILPTITIILPSVAGAEEIHLLCGKVHVTVDTDKQMAFGLVNDVNGGYDTEITLNDKVYRAIKSYEGRLYELFQVDRISGSYAHCLHPYGGQQDCYTAQCEKTSGAPQPKF